MAFGDGFEEAGPQREGDSIMNIQKDMQTCLICLYSATISHDERPNRQERLFKSP